MADRGRDRHAEPAGDAVVGRDGGPNPGMPRWVRVFLIVGLAVVLLLVVASLTGVGGEHGPGRHGSGGETPSSAVHEGGSHNPPVTQRP